MFDENIVNKKLRRLYGEQDGHANFRVAWTATQLEYRKGTFIDRDNSGNPLRVVTEVRQCLRYAYLERGYWALEKLFPVPESIAAVLVGAKWSYEPLFIFQNPQTKEALPASWDAIEAFVKLFLFGGKRKINERRNWAEEEEAEFERISTRILEYLESECPPLAAQLKSGSAVSVSNGESNDCVVSPEPHQRIQAADEPGVGSNPSSPE